jgi:hypothetical protein
MATHEARRLELALDTAKVSLAAFEGEITTAQAMTADAQTHIMGKGFPCLDVRVDSYSF